MVATTAAYLAASAGASAATAATVGTYAGYAGTAASLLGTYGAYQQNKYAGVQAEAGYKEQAQMEALKAGEESNLRRDRLLKALAAQNVAAGASGVAGSTIENLQLQSMDEYEKEQEAAGTYTQASQSALKRKAGAAKDLGRYAAYGSLLSGATRLVDAG